MTGKRKNIILLIVLLFLVGITAFLLVSGERKEKTGAYKDYFSMGEEGRISKIILEGPDYRHVFTRESEVWRLNERYPVDENLMEVLQTILNKATVKRPVANANQQKIKEILAGRGVKVTVYGDGHTLRRTFTVAGSEDREDSYFYDAESDKAFSMYIPGYDSYIAGIFELDLNEWRNKVIFSSSWRSLRSVSVDYPKDTAASFRIEFDTDFFKIPGVEQVDTSKMMAYLENLEYFQAAKVLGTPGDPRADSLLQAEPFMEISVRDIDTTKNNTLYLYPRVNKDPYVLGNDRRDRTMLIRYSDLEPLVMTKNSFSKR